MPRRCRSGEAISGNFGISGRSQDNGVVEHRRTAPGDPGGHRGDGQGHVANLRLFATRGGRHTVWTTGSRPARELAGIKRLGLGWFPHVFHPGPGGPCEREVEPMSRIYIKEEDDDDDDPLPDDHGALTVAGLWRMLWDIERFHEEAGSSGKAWDGKYTPAIRRAILRRDKAMRDEPGFADFRLYLNTELGHGVSVEAMNEVERTLSRRLGQTLEDVRRLTIRDALTILKEPERLPPHALPLVGTEAPADTPKPVDVGPGPSDKAPTVPLSRTLELVNGRTAELVRYLAKRGGREAHYDDIARDVDKARTVETVRERIRRRCYRARRALDHARAPLRLAIVSNVVSLVDSAV